MTFGWALMGHLNILSQPQVDTPGTAYVCSDTLDNTCLEPFWTWNKLYWTANIKLVLHWSCSRDTMSMKMSQMITWEESRGSQNLTSRLSPSDLEQVPSVVLVFNGPGEDIAPYLSERSSPESSDFDGLPPEPRASLAWEWKAGALVRWGEGFVCGPIVPRLSSGAPKTPRLPMCSTQNNTAQFPQPVWDKGDVLQSSPISWYWLPDVLIPSDK